MTKRSALFWDITQRTVVIPYLRFGTTYRSHFQGPINSTRKHTRALISPTSRQESGITHILKIFMSIYDRVADLLFYSTTYYKMRSLRCSKCNYCSHWSILHCVNVVVPALWATWQLFREIVRLTKILNPDAPPPNRDFDAELRWYKSELQ
jgi:hypothetical protein